MLLLTFRTAGIGTTTCIDQRFGNLEISTVTSKFPWLGLQIAPVVCVYLSIPDGGLKLSAGPFVDRIAKSRRQYRINIVTWLQCDVPDGPYISLSLVPGTVETTSTLSGPVCGTSVFRPHECDGHQRGFLDALAGFNKIILQTPSVVIGLPSSGCRVPELARLSPLVRLEMLNRHVDAPLLEHRQDFWDVALGDAAITYCTSLIAILLTKLRSEPLRARSSTRNVTEFWGCKQLVPHIRRLVPQ
ncbi:hypothetical protein CPAR01_00760 [Colletotrichum paranaense]|uniref:Uncharacterized protein n=1 Tax=Colletotrichum paranaense TaxID=1914294 RepID=A0ABQ9T4U4_9PEZI|nr:uncharacterized protein CPAR01_00760 [Colletotrichum paranaense]KAK1546793.1 hypothetical protein CPAR01_00760 [Colletotrichum paranaense]